MRMRNALIALLLAAGIVIGMILAVGQLDLAFDLGAGIVAAIVVITGLLLLALGLALAYWSDFPDPRTWRFKDVAWGIVLAEAAVLGLAWALAWAEDEFELPSGVFPAVLSVFGALLVGVSFGISAAVLRRNRLQAPAAPPPAGPGAAFVFGPVFAFWLGLAYLAILLGLATVYNTFPSVQAKLQDGIVGNVLPIGVPWYGALGAVTISLYGVFRHNHEWKVKYDPWHVARPLMGAVLGMIAYFIFVSVINATTSGGTAEVDLTDKRALIIYYVLAFVVGYREDTFRELVTRATDLIFRPSDEGGVPGGGVPGGGVPGGGVPGGGVPGGQERREASSYRIGDRDPEMSQRRLPPMRLVDTAMLTL